MKFQEFAIVEKKRRKRKPRWAAYGPGPYGGYGYFAGYSGDGGSSAGDGGVGEDQNLKELNIASTLKFIKDAHGDQLYGKLPYWQHPRAVALTGRKIFGSKFNSEAVKTAFLHDVVEDTHVGLDELKKLGFSDEVVNAVRLLTKDKSLSYSDNIRRIINSGNTLAMMVKYADNYENYTGDKSDWDQDRASASNRKYLRSLNALGDELGIKHHLGEASYEGNIGAMEVFKFMNTASSFEKELLKKLIAQKAYTKAWALVQGVTGTKLKGKEFEVEEGWRDTLAGLALGAGVAMGSPADAKVNVEKVVVSPGQTVYSIAKAFDTTPKVIQKLNKLDKDFTIKPGQEIKVPKLDWNDIPPEKEKKSEIKKKEPEKKKIDTSKTLTGSKHEAVLTKEARSSGITDPIELAAFLSQCAHETHDFKSLVEYGGSLDFRKYDPKFAPKKARSLGNTKVGDGARYKGRGYIQLTGRYNYKRAGQALGLPLEKNPELAEKPEVAAKIAVWFWQQRVQPRVDNFNDVRAVTKPINPGLNGLEDRKEAFLDFKKFKLAMR